MISCNLHYIQISNIVLGCIIFLHTSMTLNKAVVHLKIIIDLATV